MQQRIWQQLLSLESRDIVIDWFSKIHGRTLNARRAKEINSAAKQSREFFRNSDEANNSVKPILTYYGVASLARAISLLFRRDGGEESLTKGHGLETDRWSQTLSSDINVGLNRLSELKVRTCAGLFNEFALSTNNRMLIHSRSSVADAIHDYPAPTIGDHFSFGDLISRVPDLQEEHKILGIEPMYAGINELHGDREGGVVINVRKEDNILRQYQDLGYTFEIDEKNVKTNISKQVLESEPPQFLHAYLHKAFGVIPNLFLVAPLPGGQRYSQLCVLFVAAYLLGMLARYYPTHWVLLSQGDRGDKLWPTVNQLHRCIEEAFPEMVADFIKKVVLS